MRAEISRRARGDESRCCLWKAWVFCAAAPGHLLKIAAIFPRGSDANWAKDPLYRQHHPHRPARFGEAVGLVPACGANVSGAVPKRLPACSAKPQVPSPSLRSATRLLLYVRGTMRWRLEPDRPLTSARGGNAKRRAPAPERNATPRKRASSTHTPCPVTRIGIVLGLKHNC